MNYLIKTNNTSINTGMLLLRLMVGLIFFVAGAGKAMGWFGGMGIDATVNAFQTYNGISAIWAYLNTYSEWIGGLLLFIGLFTKPAAFLIAFNMLMAVILTGTKNFFMGGAAYPCSLGVSALAIMLIGPGMFSLDYLFFNKSNK